VHAPALSLTEDSNGVTLNKTVEPTTTAFGDGTSRSQSGPGCVLRPAIPSLPDRFETTMTLPGNLASTGSHSLTGKYRRPFQSRLTWFSLPSRNVAEAYLHCFSRMDSFLIRPPPFAYPRTHSTRGGGTSSMTILWYNPTPASPPYRALAAYMSRNGDRVIRAMGLRTGYPPKQAFAGGYIRIEGDLNWTDCRMKPGWNIGIALMT